MGPRAQKGPGPNMALDPNYTLHPGFYYMVFDENDLDVFYDAVSINFKNPSDGNTHLDEIYLAKPLPTPKLDNNLNLLGGRNFWKNHIIQKIHKI